MLLGAHVSMSAPNMLLGSVEEALRYGATTFMFYTGAPQNTARRPVETLKRDEALVLMEKNGISVDDVVVHAPYIVNLANTIKPETFELAVNFLKFEIERCEYLGMKRLVLHPGSHVKAGTEAGLRQVVDGLNAVITKDQSVMIALETMAGKGSEVGRNFDELKYIIDHLDHPEKVGICIDTCHLHDAGYDLTKFDDILQEIDEKIGKDKILAVHINDSKNPMGSHKDRHENIGYGYIGFETLNTICHHEVLKDVPKILETPYIDKVAPYKREIESLYKQEKDLTLKSEC